MANRADQELRALIREELVEVFCLLQKHRGDPVPDDKRAILIAKARRNEPWISEAYAYCKPTDIKALEKIRELVSEGLAV